MTVLERELFAHCIVELYNNEVNKSDIIDAPTED